MELQSRCQLFFISLIIQGQLFLCGAAKSTFPHQWYCRSVLILRIAISSAACHTTQLDNQPRLENQVTWVAEDTHLQPRDGLCYDYMQQISQLLWQAQEHGWFVPTI